MMSICYLIRSKVCRVVFSSRALRAFRLRQHSLTLDDIARSLACKESGLSENGVQGAPPLPWAERRPGGDRYASPEPWHIRLVKFGGKRLIGILPTTRAERGLGRLGDAPRRAALYYHCILRSSTTAARRPGAERELPPWLLWSSGHRVGVPGRKVAQEQRAGTTAKSRLFRG